MISGELLNTEQAAAYLGVCAGTLNQWRFKKKGPSYIKYSKRKSIRYRKEDLDAFINRSRVVLNSDLIE